MKTSVVIFVIALCFLHQATVDGVRKCYQCFGRKCLVPGGQVEVTCDAKNSICVTVTSHNADFSDKSRKGCTASGPIAQKKCNFLKSRGFSCDLCFKDLCNK